MGKAADGDGEDGGEPVRTTWFGMNQPRPRLPDYFHAKKRLKSLDEFEEPYWKGRVRFGDDDDDAVTLKGVASETLRWLLIFAIVGVVGGAAWMWLGSDGCAEFTSGFKLGWC